MKDMNEKAVVEVAGLIRDQMVDWQTGAFDDYFMRWPSEADRLEVPKSLRAQFVHTRIVTRMHADSSIRWPFRPNTSRQLHMIVYDGEEADLIIIFKKLYRWQGRLRSRGWLTDQQQDRRTDSLSLFGKERITLVCGHTVNDTSPGLIDRIYIGHEWGSFFEWACPLWSAADGFRVPAVDEQLPLLPMFRLKIRRTQIVIPKSLIIDANQPKVGEGPKLRIRKNKGA